MTEELDLAHPPVQRYVDRSRTLMLKVGNLERSLQEDPIQVFFIGPAPSMRSLCRLLAGMAPAAGVSVARTEYAERDLALVDVLALNCNKGAALARHAKRQGMEPSQIMALGDNWNDLEMLELAGLPVIMGNSSQDLKERGWPVTAKNDENGVAQAIRRYLLDN
jgi:phosphoserine phosphatase